MIEFEHGTATGKRIVKIDGKIHVNRDWMFRLVGDEVIEFGTHKFVIRVDPVPGESKLSSLFCINSFTEYFSDLRFEIFLHVDG